MSRREGSAWRGRHLKKRSSTLSNVRLLENRSRNIKQFKIKLADMATKIEASRLLIYSASAKRDRRERCDLEAGMAKLFATETAAEVSLEAMRILGGNGFSKDFPVERYYRDAPLLVIGGGTNELQRLIIARQLLERYAVK